VPRQTVQVRALAGYLRARAAPPLCLVAEGSVAADPLATALATALGSRVAEQETVPADGPVPDGVTAHLRDAGCGTVAWAGSSTGAATLRIAMTGAGLGDVPLVGSDLVKTDTYLTTTGRAGEGTVVSCPCADLSTSTALRAQVFVHDYQSEFGTPPAPFAAEGWDAGELLARALAGGADRASVRTAIGGISRFEGLAATYVVGADGELARGTARVGFWVDRGQRWATPRWQEPRSDLG
jgi:branched-chain amino acid transport system substrate-binding protein